MATASLWTNKTLKMPTNATLPYAATTTGMGPTKKPHTTHTYVGLEGKQTKQKNRFH